MYRIARAAGQVRERRRAATHPPRVRPELLARGPNQVWSRDITAPNSWSHSACSGPTPPSRLERQPLPRSPVQDDEAHARLPPTGSAPWRTPTRSARNSSSPATTNAATPASRRLGAGAGGAAIAAEVNDRPHGDPRLEKTRRGIHRSPRNGCFHRLNPPASSSTTLTSTPPRKYLEGAISRSPADLSGMPGPMNPANQDLRLIAGGGRLPQAEGKVIRCLGRWSKL